MVNKNSKKINFNGMSYREIQSINSEKRNNLKKEDQKWLKAQGYINVGWDNIISLYHKIEECLDKYPLKDLTLEELFLEADRIGNKYLTSQEIQEFNHKLSKEVNDIAEEIDKQFPNTEIEVIDFSNNTNPSSWRKNNRKFY
ncbi:MAG TPA: hypothetical protein V6D26_25710 [Stenomitos sp.]